MKRLGIFALTLLMLTATAQETTVLTVGSFPSLSETTTALAEAYMEMNPDVTIEMQILEFGDYHNALTTSLATGEGAPDVSAIEVGFIAKFVADGGLVDLSQPPFNAGEYTPLIADYAVAQGTTADGRIVAMPTDLGPGVLYWRRDRFEEVGAEVSDVLGSWDDYIAFGKQVTRDLDGDGANDVFLIADAADVYNAMIRTGLEEGQGIYFDSNGEVLVNTERFYNAFAVAKEIRDAGLDAQIGAWSNEWYQAFKDGAVATQMSGAWLRGQLENWMAPETTGLWGAENLPGGSFSTWGGSFYAIPEQSDNKELAWDFIKFMTTTEQAQLDSFALIEAFPALKSTWEDPIFQEEIPFLANQQARLLFIDIIDNIQGTVTHPGDVVAQEIVTNALSQVLNEDRPIEDALANAERLIQRRVR
ncbi:MAG: extracellular solute-binding protein [Deinococcota bacterium]